jgi:flagellar FliJ protein
MKRFAFRLERVLRQRALQEELAEQALGGALRAERRAVEACDAVRVEIARASEEMASRLAGSVCGSDLLLHARYAAGLRGRESARRRDRAEAQARSRERRDALLERRRAREVVSQLRGRAWERYREAEAHETQAVLDDVAGQQHARRKGEEE